MPNSDMKQHKFLLYSIDGKRLSSALNPSDSKLSVSTYRWSHRIAKLGRHPAYCQKEQAKMQTTKKNSISMIWRRDKFAQRFSCFVRRSKSLRLP
jgi:hypothetical protein